MDVQAPPDPFPIPFYVGTAFAEPARNRLTVGDEAISLEPKVMAVICCLAADPGQVIRRSDLIDRVWAVEHGGDESLTRAVSILRKALGSAAIETVSKRGYRLNLAVIPAAGASPPQAPAGPVRRRWPFIAAAVLAVALIVTGFTLWRSAETRRTLAAPDAGITLRVEPFTATAGKESDARALSDDLAGRISGFSLYKVTSTPASPKDSAGGLNYVLAGRIDGDGKVTVQLVDAAGGAHLWAQTYPRPSDASELVTVIASELQSPLLVAVKDRLKQRPILSLRPWELNLLVTWVPGGEGAPPGPPTENSFWLQKRALDIDPDYAPAHATFAEMLAYHALFDPPSDTEAARQRARDHADRALQLAPYNAEVLYHVATYYRFTGDRDKAASLLKRVLQLQPSYLTAQADLAFVEGQCQADNNAQVRALEDLNRRLSPANPARWLVLSHLADLKLGADDAPAAAALAAQSRDIVTTSWSSITLAAAKAQAGDRRDLTVIAHEHDAQWTHLDYDDFADRAVARWCLNGPATPGVQATFHRLGASLKRAQ